MIWFFLILIALAAILQGVMANKALERTDCAIFAPDHLTEPGETFCIRVQISNHSRLPVFFLRFCCHIPLSAQLQEGSPGTAVTYVNTSEYRLDCFLLPRQRREYSLHFRIAERGVYRFQGLQLSCGDFLGVKEQQAYYPGACSVVVLPARPRSSSLPEVMGGLLGERTVRRWLHEDPILTAGFHEYTGAEPMKAISWNRSLRSGRLMVRQPDHTTENRVTVLLCAEGGSAETIEGSLRLCRAVCEQLEQKRISYSFLHSGLVMTDIGILPPLEDGLGPVHLNRILEGLGRAVPFLPGTLEELIRRTLARDHSSCCYLLIAQRPTAQVRRQAQWLEQRSGSRVELLFGEDDL